MNNDIRELSVDELDKVSGGAAATTKTTIKTTTKPTTKLDTYLEITLTEATISS
jgi:hypothetical protein